MLDRPFLGIGVSVSLSGVRPLASVVTFALSFPARRLCPEVASVHLLLMQIASDLSVVREEGYRFILLQDYIFRHISCYIQDTVVVGVS